MVCMPRKIFTLQRKIGPYMHNVTETWSRISHEVIMDTQQRQCEEVFHKGFSFHMLSKQSIFNVTSSMYEPHQLTSRVLNVCTTYKLTKMTIYVPLLKFSIQLNGCITQWIVSYKPLNTS